MSAEGDLYAAVPGSAPTAPVAPPADAGDTGPMGQAWTKVKSVIPDVSHLYLQPLDPASELSIGDRASLVWQSARPWREFFDLTAFNLPPMEQAKTRVSNNVETYLYNYFLLTCLHVALFSLGHFGSLFAMGIWGAILYYLFAGHPEDFELGKFTIGGKAKCAIAVVTGLLAIFPGHGMTSIISVTVFLLIIVGIHAIIRDDTTEQAEPVV